MKNTRLLIVEGWLPDYALLEAQREFNDKNYTYIITTGSQLETGSFLSEYKNFAELGKARLVKLGISPQKIFAVSAGEVWRNRTYKSAVATLNFLKKNPKKSKRINIMTLGCHSRRTLLVYKKVFPPDYKFGVLSVRTKSFAPNAWWQTSAGLKAIVTEFLSYTYELLLDSGRKKSYKKP